MNHPLRLLSLALCAALTLAAQQIGRRAPGFTLPDLKMQYQDLYDYRGKVVLLDFMKTSCPHCVGVAKTTERVKRKYGDRVAVFAVVLPPDTVRTVQTFLKDHSLSMNVLFDCGQMTASYLLPSPQNPSVDFPHLFVIDQRGMIVGSYDYSEPNKEILEGDGLFPILDKLLASSPRAGFSSQDSKGEQESSLTAKLSAGDPSGVRCGSLDYKSSRCPNFSFFVRR